MNRHRSSAVAAALCAVLLAAGPLRADPPAPAAGPTTRPEAKPISENVTKGLAWLAKNQLDSGAWGQGEESANMGGGASLKDQPNVADTCMTLMAFFRAGHSPKAGQFKTNVLKGVLFVCAQVEESDNKSLYITNLRSTRTQQKLGTFIDTFLAAQMLAELKDHMPDADGVKRVNNALGKVLEKIEMNQGKDGRWANEGWAPALAQAAAAKAINAAAATGARVSEEVRVKAETVARADFDKSVGGTGSITLSGGAAATSTPAAGPVAVAGRTGGDAGVKLYSDGGNIAAMQASDIYNQQKEAELKKLLDSPTTQPEAKDAARAQLARIAENRRDLERAQDALIAKLDDKQFIAGFGSNGGEEFLSHLNIGESLFIKGGEAWTKWDKSMTANLNQIQNQDGSWTGHHCVTGRTFCTSAALMVLTIDRSPLPAAAKITEAKGK